MGQYHYPVNLTKREFIHPHRLGVGLKLWEQMASRFGTGSALIMLLAVSNGRGGGDFDDHPEVVGRWGGDQIAIVGDYAEDGDLPAEFKASEIYRLCRSNDDDELPAGDVPYTNITDLVAAVIEKELGGRYIGTGWRDFVHKGQDVFRWGADREKELGKVVELGATTVTVQWPTGRKTYDTSKRVEFMSA